MRSPCRLFFLSLLGCASGQATQSKLSDPTLTTTPPPLPEQVRVDVLQEVQRAPKVAPELSPPISEGELPWWHGLKAGVYRFNGALRVIAVGASKDHHHVAEGLLLAKVKARLKVRKASERIAFKSAMPEPQLLDVFVTRQQQILALHSMLVPSQVVAPEGTATLLVPERLLIPGRHRIGRHIFEGTRHLFMECDVEGPLTNPDWGRSRASVRP